MQETVEEIDIDLADPEVGKAALAIQSKFRKKSKSPKTKSPSPAAVIAKKSQPHQQPTSAAELPVSKEKSPQIASENAKKIEQPTVS